MSNHCRCASTTLSSRIVSTCRWPFTVGASISIFRDCSSLFADMGLYTRTGTFELMILYAVSYLQLKTRSGNETLGPGA